MRRTPLDGLLSALLTTVPPALPRLVARVRDWPTESQLRARRNAMVASTECARRRAERDDVAEFLERLAARPASQVAEAARR